MRSALLCSFLCLTLVFPPVASAAKLRVFNDQDYDFSALRNYAWRTHPEMEQEPAQGVIAGEIVMSEGNQILMGRGYLPVEDSPDFYITFFVKGEQRVEATMLATSWDYGPRTAWSGYNETIYRNFISGTLVIDIVEAETDNLVWRALYQDKVTNWKTRDKIITKAVQNALKKFPPKSRK